VCEETIEYPAKAEDVGVHLESTTKGSKDAARKGNEEVVTNLRLMVQQCDEASQEMKANLKELRKDRFQIAVARKRRLTRNSFSSKSYANVSASEILL